MITCGLFAMRQALSDHTGSTFCPMFPTCHQESRTKLQAFVAEAGEDAIV